MVRVLLVEDHAAFRQPLARLLQHESGIEEVRQAGTVAEARQLLEGIDVALVDVHLPDGTGIELVSELGRSHQCAVVVLTGSSDEVQLAQAVESGAVGVLQKFVGVDEILVAIRKAAAGEPIHSVREVMEMMRVAGDARERDRDAARALGSLTAREREVLESLADGLSDKAIADRFGISPDTARNHVANVLSKVGVESRLQALVFAIRHGAVRIR